MELQQQQRNSITCWRACQLRALRPLQRTGQGRSCMHLTMCGAKRQTVLLVVTLAGQPPVLCCTGQLGHCACMLCMRGWWQQQVRRCSFCPCSVSLSLMVETGMWSQAKPPVHVRMVQMLIRSRSLSCAARPELLFSQIAVKAVHCMRLLACTLHLPCVLMHSVQGRPCRPNT